MQYNPSEQTFYLDGAMYQKAQADLDMAQANLKMCRICGALSETKDDAGNYICDEHVAKLSS